ncbi:MAG: hypothetical protein KIT22_05990, partial [Verrucomicrobiae bacterium]|nr:hypothetical protein [Verrucomicrobiae bacterium]
MKELLQNADDAGAAQAGHAATQCVFALSDDGLASAQHTLLRGPGLAVINDGSFTAEDANSLTSLGLSNKAGESAAAGKFGLGLKSIFHWAEAFFYFSPHNFGGDSDIQSSGHDLLNPWSSRDTKTGRHREWDEEWRRTQKDDYLAFSSLVSAMQFSERWFGLWIPLRRRTHTEDGQGSVQPIENRFPEAKLDEILGYDWRRRLGETLPLLRRIRSIRFCQRSRDAWQTVAEMRVGDGARRMCFGTEAGFTTRCPNNELSGQINGDGRSADLTFRGREFFAAIPALTQLRDHSAWPSQSTLGPDGADSQVKEKAEPHGAVIFTRQAVDGQPVLRVHQAVFLPLGEPEQVECAGKWRYNLYLHGFFFVDSGRRGIQRFDELPDEKTPDTVESESQVTPLWNRTLLHELVAPLVLPSLDAFVKQERMEPAEVESLAEALEKALRKSESKALKQLIPRMCAQQRFIYRLSPTGSQWVLEKSAEQGLEFGRWIELPALGFSEAELFSLLPGLTDLSSQVSVSLKGKPNLADHEPTLPSDDELAGLLGSMTVSAFHDLPHLSYLLKLIPRGASEGRPDSPLIAALVRLANRLVSERIPGDKKLAQQWREFFKQLPTTVIVRLPAEPTAVSPEIARILGESDLPAALLWEDFREAEGSGSVPWRLLLPVLSRLGSEALSDAESIQQRSAITVRLLGAADEQPQNWTTQIEQLPLFAAHEPNRDFHPVSFADLQAANSDGRLFTGGDAWARDLAKAAPDLKPLLVKTDAAKALDLQASACDGTACVRLLRGVVRLTGDFMDRKPLFEQLLKEAQPTDAEAWAALRCLLHGEIGAWQEMTALFDETGTQP